MKTIRVVAAIIHKDGKIFATQRGYGAYKDYWEFPGGKVEAGETPEEALIREIKEELATTIQPEQFLMEVEYDYPEFHLSMDDHILICLGHGAVPPSPGLFQAVDPGLKICFRDVSAEALALQPGSCTCKSLHVGAASADAASA